MTYKAILFDLDDTLYDFRAFWRGRLDLGLAAVLARDPQRDGAALMQAAMAGWVFVDQWPAFLRAQGIADETLIAAAHAAYGDGWFDAISMSAEAARVLPLLRPRFKLGLITNGPAHTQRPKIARFGLAELMDVLLVSGEVGIAKPDPAIFHIALDALGVQPAEALFVGDAPEYDLRGAAAAGIAAVWINARGEPLPPDTPAPMAEIRRLDELLALPGVSGDWEITHS